MWFNGLRCTDCENLNKNDRNKYGDAYCPVIRKYVELDSYTCRDFIANFYVMTAYCDINKISYDSNMMTTLISFRDNYMMNNESGKEFLEEYEGIGPILASRLSKDMYKSDIVEEMDEEYITPMLDFILLERYDDAQNTYIEMIDSLKVRYGYAPIKDDKIKRL